MLTGIKNIFLVYYNFDMFFDIRENDPGLNISGRYKCNAGHLLANIIRDNGGECRLVYYCYRFSDFFSGKKIWYIEKRMKFRIVLWNLI